MFLLWGRVSEFQPLWALTHLKLSTLLEMHGILRAIEMRTYSRCLKKLFSMHNFKANKSSLSTEINIGYHFNIVAIDICLLFKCKQNFFK